MNPIQPAGITPASLWSLPGAPTPIRAAAVLAPELDARTGARVSLDGQGDPVMNSLALQFRTVRGSGVSVADDGTELFSIEKNGEDAPALIEFEMARVLEPFVEQGLITVDPTVITAGPDAGNRATVLERVHRAGSVEQGVEVPNRGGAAPTESR